MPFKAVSSLYLSCFKPASKDLQVNSGHPEIHFVICEPNGNLHEPVEINFEKNDFY